IDWVNQLVVRTDYRQQGIATFLLVIGLGYIAFWLVSSHSAACSTDPGRSYHSIRLIAVPAKQFLKSTPMEYLRRAGLRGSLFGQGLAEASAVVSGVFTQFYVDHDEPLPTLKEYEGK
ncbi:hypothetical protein BU15DRAFT_46740, partial [Melanogaster broomeanus]